MKQLKKLPPKPKQGSAGYHEFVVKAQWDATAILLKVPARNADEALLRAESLVKHVEGGTSCGTIKVIRQTR